MAKVVREDIDNLNAVLTITLEKADYEPQFKAELNKYRKEAHMKGFRKGKTPVSVIRKMYGKAVLAEVINKKLQAELSKYLIDNEVNMLGQPLPSEDQEGIEFDLKEMQDYEFRFDLGITPEFEVEGVSEDDEYEKLEVVPKEEEIEKQLNDLRRQHGEQVQVEDGAQDEDIIKLKATKLADGGIPETDGPEGEFSLLVSRIGNEDIKADVLGKKPGESFRANLLQLEEGTDEAYVRKYYLQLEEEEEEQEEGEGEGEGEEKQDIELDTPWELTIQEITRLAPAELDQEFFDAVFGEGEVEDEAAAREKIKEGLKANYNNQAEALLFRDFQDRLMEKNDIDLPDDFLNRWIIASNENVDPEQVKKEYPLHAKNIKWSLIKGKLNKRFDLKIEEAEIRNAFANRVRGYFGGSPIANDTFIDNMVDRLMENEEQYNQLAEEVATDKLHDAIKAVVQINTKEVTSEEFEKISEEAQAAAEQAQRVILDTGEEE